MSNVSNPSGPVNPTNSGRSSEPIKPGTDKFKDLMKIDSSDEKQKKRNKQSSESEEENKAKLQVNLASKNRPLSSTKKTEKFPKVRKAPESDKKQPHHQKRAEETTPAEPEEAISAATAQKKPFEPIESLEGVETLKEEATIKQESSAQLHRDLEELLKEDQQIVQKEVVAENYQQASAHVEKKKKEETNPTTAQPAAPTSSSLGPSFLMPTTEVPPAYALLSSEAFALFEKMVSLITVLHDSGLTETVIHLNTQEFANSPFMGSQIVIREYSTAPLAYNIELIGNPLAANLFTKNISLLRNAFEEGKYRFRINRLESSISKEGPDRVERKKGSADEEA